MTYFNAFAKRLLLALLVLTGLALLAALDKAGFFTLQNS